MNFLFFELIFLCLLQQGRLEKFVAEFKSLQQLEIGDDGVSNIVYACGDEFMETSCKCQNNSLNCDREYVIGKPLSNSDVKVIDETFIIKKVDFSRNSIKVLTKTNILLGKEKTITELSFENNPISKIESRGFDKFISLTSLNLKDANLTSIDENVLTEKLGSTLLTLNLGGNKLLKLFPTSFKHLIKLTHLYLNKNPSIGPYLTKEVFSPSLKNLKWLDLCWCKISSLDEDAFVNLVNLDTLVIHMNPLTSIPLAINPLSNLRFLDISHTNITVIKNDGLVKNYALEELHFIGMFNLIAVDDCAFCPFPNLKEIGFTWSHNLTTINENAFGAITEKTIPPIKKFDVSFTNITTLFEKLFNWETTEEISFSSKNFNCDCSMAWLINDIALPNSKFSKKIKRIFSAAKRQCQNPPNLRNKTFDEVSGKICNGKLSSFSQPTTKFNFHWLLLAAIIFAIGILCYVYQINITNFIYGQKCTKLDDDEEQLKQYFNPEIDNDSL